MTRITDISLIKRAVLTSFAVTLTLLYPSIPLFAETAVANDAPDGQSQTTTDQPTGEDATTYHYNASSGTWENEHYTWDPVTRKTTPKDNLPYSYNSATGRWDTTEWRYNGTTGKWEPNTISTSQPPVGSQNTNESAAVDVPSSMSNSDVTSSSTIAPTEPADTTNADVPTLQDVHSSLFDDFYNAVISNTANTGNAAVTGNNVGGSASSGNAYAISNVFNMFQSTSSFNDLSAVNTFVTNIDGDIAGDLFIDPSQLGNLQPAHTSAGMNPDIQVNIAQNNSITNNLDIDATSGNAVVYGNNTAGNASSGNANAVANLVNLINSSIAANQSFIGTLNINGNLNGDILLPPEVLQTLLASNAPTTTISLPAADGVALQTSLSDNQSINNNVKASAMSGNATVSDNNIGGSATSGSSKTNVTVLNLTGRQVVGVDSLLVFVNVLGKWVGALINAPQGVTAAALGGGITENTATMDSENSTLAAADNNTITNNVAVRAQTGNATIKHNRVGGNATSGDASTSANISNVSNSHVSMSGWFGMLFINVFGSWIGSFGIDTDAGEKVPQDISNNDASTTTNPSTQAPRVFRFSTATGDSTSTSGTIAAEVNPQTNTRAQPQVLGAETAPETRGSQSNSLTTATNFNFPLGALSLSGGLFAVERAFATRQRHGRH